MLKIEKMDDGRVRVSSDSGGVDIGEGIVGTIICSPDEVEYIDETPAVKEPKKGTRR